MSGAVSALIAAVTAASPVGLSEWARSYHGHIWLNGWLHSWPHCSFEHGCNYLPFHHDTAFMATKKGAEVWAETLLLIGFIPFAILALYLLIDICARCLCRCCGCGSRRRVHQADGSVRRPGCCSRLLCCRECGVDDDEGEDDQQPGAFLSPAARVSAVGRAGSGGYGSVAIVQQAAVRRGGTAGQTTDAFHLLQDPSNPFTTSSRLIPVEARDFDAEEEARRIAEMENAEATERPNPDARFRCRMLWALFLSLLALAALAASLYHISQAHVSVDELQDSLHSTQSYLLDELATGSLGALQADLDSTAAGLLAVSAGALNLSRPLTDAQAQLVSATAANYAMVSPRFLGEFAQRLENTSRHVHDLDHWMSDAEEFRVWASYWTVGILMFFVLVLLLVHAAMRRRPWVSLSTSTLVALALVLVSLLGFAGVMFSVGVSDACMDPMGYARAAMNSTELLPPGAEPFKREEVRTVEFYLDCTQQPDPLDPSVPLATWPSNPLYGDFLAPALRVMQSQLLEGGLAQVQQFIAEERTDLAQYGAALARINATTYTDVMDLEVRLGCERAHGFIVDAMNETCNDITTNVWTIAALQVGACLLLLLVRCLVWMRRRRAPDPLDEGAYDTMTTTTTTTSGVVVTGGPSLVISAEPFIPVGVVEEGKDAAEGWSTNSSVMNIKTYARV